MSLPQRKVLYGGIEEDLRIINRFYFKAAPKAALFFSQSYQIISEPLADPGVTPYQNVSRLSYRFVP
jgi:hypothetical protein